MNENEKSITHGSITHITKLNVTKIDGPGGKSNICPFINSKAIRIEVGGTVCIEHCNSFVTYTDDEVFCNYGLEE